MEKSRPKRYRPNRKRPPRVRIPGYGPCRGCLRDLYIYGEAGADYCEACLLAIRRHPGVDITTLPNGRSERIPQERPDDDEEWQRDGRCVGAPPELFEGRVLGNGIVPEDEFDIAAVYCANCSVVAQCDTWANRHKFVGIFGGTLRTLVGGGQGKPPEYKRRDLLGDLRPVTEASEEREEVAA